MRRAAERRRTFSHPNGSALARYSVRMGASFHPDSWDFDASTYRVRDAVEETIADLAAFYGGTVHELNQENLSAPFYGDPAKYGAYAGTVIHMPASWRARALAMPCPAGFSTDARGYCVADTTKGALCPAGQAVDPATGLCYDPAKGGPPGPDPGKGAPPAKTAKPPMSTLAKVGIGLGAASAAAGLAYTIFRFTREA